MAPPFVVDNGFWPSLRRNSTFSVLKVSTTKKGHQEILGDRGLGLDDILGESA